jgi:hypothetical protein
LNSLLYKCYTLPSSVISLCNSWHKHSPSQQLNYTLTHIMILISYSTHTSHPFSPSCYFFLLALPLATSF